MMSLMGYYSNDSKFTKQIIDFAPDWELSKIHNLLKRLKRKVIIVKIV